MQLVSKLGKKEVEMAGEELGGLHMPSGDRGWKHQGDQAKASPGPAAAAARHR